MHFEFLPVLLKGSYFANLAQPQTEQSETKPLLRHITPFVQLACYL